MAPLFSKEAKTISNCNFFSLFIIFIGSHLSIFRIVISTIIHSFLLVFCTFSNKFSKLNIRKYSKAVAENDDVNFMKCWVITLRNLSNQSVVRTEISLDC